jgi:hypothetical protein
MDRGVAFVPGKTGEGKDKIITKDPTASFGFQNVLPFSTVDSNGQPSLFFGGIISDVGELSAQVSAATLPDTFGTTITESLFDLLEPQASLFGATLFDEGDFIDVVFDPDKTLSQGGVVFGTTSFTDGAFGSVQSTPEPSTLLLLAGGVGGIWLAARARLRRRAVEPSSCASCPAG